MRVEDLSLADLVVLRETLAVCEKIGRLDPLARFDLTPGQAVRVELPSLRWPDVNTRGGLSPVAREGAAAAPHPPSHPEVGASVPASGPCEPVAPAGEAVPHVPPVAAAVPAGAGEQTAPAVLEGVAPADDSPVRESGTGAPPDELGRHLWSLSRKGDWHFGADAELMRLACLGWTVPAIAAEMGRGHLEVKRRFRLLVDDGTFKRDDVLARLNAFLDQSQAAE